MRLTKDLIGTAPQSLNALGDRQITLRSHRIAAVENLDVTNDAFDTIDLTDNDLIRLDGFTPLPHLGTLIVANNRISRIARDLSEFIPNLKCLVASGNQLEALQDLLPLSTFSKLVRVQLYDNPVTAVSHYRDFLVHYVPTIRYIDFQRVTLKDREAAKTFFESEDGKALFAKISDPASRPKLDTSNIPGLKQDPAEVKLL